MSGRYCQLCGRPLRGSRHRLYCSHRCNGRAQASRRAAKIREALSGGVVQMAAWLQTELAEAEREAAGISGRRGRRPKTKAA